MVTVKPLPTATLSGTTVINYPNPAQLTFNLTGTLLWTIVYTDGTSNYTITGIIANPYLLNVTPSSGTTYSLVSVSDNNCTGTVNGNAIVSVINSMDKDLLNSFCIYPNPANASSHVRSP